jgi:hypothetical protein
MVEPVAVGEHLNSLVVLALPGAKMDPLENESSDEWKLQFVCPAEIQEKLVAVSRNSSDTPFGKGT